MSCAPVLDCQLAAAASAMTASFGDSTSIMRRSAVTSDGAGGFKPTSGDGWLVVATVNGLLTTSRYQPRERVIADQITAPVIHKWYGPATADVRTQDRLVIGSRTFEVQGVSKDTTGMPIEVFLAELQFGQAIV